MHYLISHSKDPHWHIDESNFLTRFGEQWPVLILEPVQNPEDYYAWEWNSPHEATWIYGGLSRDGKTVCLEGDTQACATFCVWVQELYPDQPLFLYNGGGNVDLILLGKTPEQVYRAMTKT